MNPHYQRGHCGIDDMGRPLFVERTGLINIDKVFELVPDEDYWRYIYQSYEILLKRNFLACSLLKQHQVFQVNVILDINGFGISKLNKRIYGVIQKLTQTCDKYYPE